MVTKVPATPLTGLKLVIVGPPLPLVTVNETALVAVPDGAVTLTVPVVAPLGTVATTCVALADVTTAAIPLKDTAFWLAVVLNPVPLTVTFVPTGPLVGESSIIEVCEEEFRLMERRFPTASY